MKHGGGYPGEKASWQPGVVSHWDRDSTVRPDSEVLASEADQVGGFIAPVVLRAHRMLNAESVA